MFNEIYFPDYSSASSNIQVQASTSNSLPTAQFSTDFSATNSAPFVANPIDAIPTDTHPTDAIPTDANSTGVALPVDLPVVVSHDPHD